MAINTDLSRRPYFDEFDPNDNFHRVLFRPSTAVQTRELNELQTILQDQIDKFGRHIFKNGSVVEGCSFTFDRKYHFVKINDTYTNNFAISTTEDFIGNYVENDNGLQALIINSIDGLESAAPDFNTLYVSYLNSATYANGSQQKTFDKGDELTLYTTSNVQIGTSNIEVATPANTSEQSVGLGYAFTTTEGVIFKDGFFIRVPSQTLIVSKYDNVPNNVSIGFKLEESIITPEADTNLLDNSAGSPNFSAPGAHRLKLVPTLEKRTTSNTDVNIFFSLCDFKNGYPITIKNDAQYAALGVEQARRTYETNGDFVVRPFLLSTEPHSSNSQLLNLLVSQGLGYAKGYRVEYLNNNILQLRKGIDSANGEVTITTNYQNYFLVNDYVGEFDTDDLIEVDLHNAFKNALTNRQFLGVTAGSTKIGTARIRSVIHNSGSPGEPEAEYRIYVFDISMNSGYSTSDVKSIMYQISGSTIACADIIQVYNASIAANTTRLEGADQASLIFRLGPKALTTNGFGSSASFSYRNKYSGTFLANGHMSMTLASDSLPYSGTLSTDQKQEFIIIPTANQVSTKTGTANTFSNTIIRGNSSTFTVDYFVGDYILVDGDTRRITKISNNTYMEVDANTSYSNTTTTHKKIFIKGTPIPLDRSNRSINIVSSTAADISLNDTFDSSGTMGAVIYHKAKRSSAQPIIKDIKKSRYVKINCSNSTYGTAGPWPLGFSDVHKINAVYIGTSGAYSNTGVDYKDYFTLDNGQRDSYYAISTLKAKTNSLLSNTSTILVEFDYFDHDESTGKGFFTAASYPVYANDYVDSTHISIKDIPIFTASKGQTFDLRDYVDFRPYANSTATDTTVVGSATVNPSGAITWDLPPEGSYIPVPESEFSTDLAYYLPRVDRVMMNSEGQIKILEGESSLKPIPPLAREDLMNLGTIRVSQYPTLTPKQAKSANRYDYSVVVDVKQNRRYTMKDISDIENRINVLEYYTSLNLLEKSASDLLVRSDDTGLNRFKNGFLVDPFNGFDITNTLHPGFNAAVDKSKSELRPRFFIRRYPFHYDSSKSSNVVKKGNLIMLPHTSVSMISQNNATKYRNCIEGNIYNHVGRIEFNAMQGSPEPSYVSSPDVISNLDLSANWITLANAWETEWGAWENVGSAEKVGGATPSGPETLTGTTYNPDGSTTYTYTTQTLQNFKQNQLTEGQKLVAEENTTSTKIGNFVTNVSLLPYIPGHRIPFYAYDLKPNTDVWLYFNDVLMSYTNRLGTKGYVHPLPVETNAPNIQPNDIHGFTGLSTQLTTDAYGRVFGIIFLPSNTFKTEQSLIKILDVDDLTQGEDAITTSASVEYYASKLQINKADAILNTRSPILKFEEVQNNRTITFTGPGSPILRTETIPPPPPPTCSSCSITTTTGCGNCGGK